MTKQLLRAVFWIPLIFGWMWVCHSQTGTLIGLFESGRDAFLSQHYTDAVGYFQTLEDQFDSEPEFEQSTFQKFYISMYGMSALLSGDAGLASEKLEHYVERFYEKKEKDSLILLGLIQAKRQMQAYGELDALYGKFLSDYPEHPDRFLIRFERMLALFRQEELEKGMQEIDRVCTIGAPKNLRFRARLVGIQENITRGMLKEAGELLLSTQWDVTQMPEMAVLATSALNIGAFYMEQEQWEYAIQAYRWVPFYRTLIETQRKRLGELQRIMENVKKEGGGNRSSLWSAHYQNLIAQVNSRLEHLENGDDYTPTFLLKYGRCFLFNSQFAEAWVVFRSLALTEGIDRIVEEQAWYHWILSSHGAENWDEARELCLSFAKRFPESVLLPKTFYMLARTHQESGDYLRANRVLSDLIERFPSHEDVPSWFVTRGFNLAALNENEHALIDFQSAIDHPKINQALLVRARYWKGVTLSALDEYDAAIEVFEKLMETFPDHWMSPEFQYRLATVLYSKRDYDATERGLKTFISENPQHFYVPEAEVLLGDVAMGKGDLEEAIERFQSIPQGNANLYMYAFFQIGKIYRAKEQYAEMETHFRNYLDAPAFKGKARTSEALYWLGWAMSQQEREIESLPLYLEAVARFGNDPEASELIPMIQALEVLKKKMAFSDDPADGGDSVPEVRRFLSSFQFDQWLVDEIDRAKSSESKTYYARLQLYEALKLRRAGQDELARSAIQGISLKTPLEAMDDLLLGEIGVSLAEDGFEACMDYLRRLLIVYPKSPSKALAYFGLGIFDASQLKWEDSLKWLNLFQKETPNHARMFDVRLLRAKALMELGHYEQASEAYNDMLRLKAARGIPHVTALLGLAVLHQKQGQPGQAIPYYQRIYTLYRAYRPQVAKAYLASAQLFDAMGEIDAAHRTLLEFMDQSDLIEFPEYGIAGRELERLQTTIDAKETATETEETGTQLSHPVAEEGVGA